MAKRQSDRESGEPGAVADDAPVPMKYVKCKIYWAGKEQENRQDPIVMCILGVTQRTVVMPGQSVKLHPALVNYAENLVVEKEQQIPMTSGIYQQPNPTATAKARFPGYTAEKNRNTGQITMKMTRPIYVVSRG